MASVYFINSHLWGVIFHIQKIYFASSGELVLVNFVVFIFPDLMREFFFFDGL